MKTMYILGQVLRAFPGTIKQDVKTEIAKQCYLLGLRVLGFVMGIVQTHTDELRSYFGALIREQRAVVRLSEIPSSAEEVILNLMNGWAFGIVKGISASVGLAELEATYAEVASQIGDNLSVKVVDLSVRLDHFYDFPRQQVASVLELTKKNRFSRNILRDLVVHHLALFQSTNAIRQEYGKLLDIKISPLSDVQKQLPKPEA
jgi:hypothetical protein